MKTILKLMIRNCLIAATPNYLVYGAGANNQLSGVAGPRDPRTGLIASLACALMLGFCGVLEAANPPPNPVVDSFEVPGSSPRGLAWDGQSLWLVDNLRTVYQLDPAGHVLKSFKLGLDPYSWTWDGSGFWTADDANEQQVKFDRDGSRIATMKAWYWYESGAAWDGTNFWIADYNSAEIHMHDAAGVQRRYFRIFGFNDGGIEHPTGMVCIGDQLWIGDPNEGFENNIAVFDKEGHLLHSFNTEDWGISPVSWPEFKALAWDGTFLWYSADDLFRVYKLDISRLPGVIVETAPSITKQPVSQRVVEGATATFAVTANGTPPLTYRWQRDGVNLDDGGSISGAFTTTLTIAKATNTDRGNYRLLVSNAFGSALSDTAALNVESVESGQLTLALYAGVQVAGTVGATYRLESTTGLGDAATWSPVVEFVLPQSPFLYVDTNSPAQGRRFYRLIPFR